MKIRLLLLLTSLALLAACSAPSPSNTETPTRLPPSVTLPPTAVITPMPSATRSPAPSATASPTPLTPTATVSPSPTPEYTNLRGVVTVAQAVCHYGPGKPYLYKYGVVEGSRLEIIARLEDASFLEVRAIGGDNPCWLNAEYMRVEGDIQQVRPVRPEDVDLPWSPYYAALPSAAAKRDGNQVTVWWPPLILKAGDGSEQVPYLLETWLCREGQLRFEPAGAWQTQITLTDEPGCSQPSHARLYGVEKHGYTKWIEVPWPQAQP